MTSLESDGVTTVGPAAAKVDGKFYNTAISNGITTVAVQPTGLLSASAESDGVTTVSAACNYTALPSLESDGVTTVTVAYAPDLSDNEPIAVGIQFTGVSVLIPPSLDT